MTRRSACFRFVLPVLGFCLSAAALFGLCGTWGCRAVESGAFLGISIPAWGIIYFSTLAILSLLEKVINPFAIGFARSVLVAIGTGCDAALVFVLVSTRTVCLVCFGIATVMFLICSLEVITMLRTSKRIEKKFRFLACRLTSVGAAFVAGVLFMNTCSFPVQGFGNTAYAAEDPVPGIGTGSKSIRVYSDYFCPGCRNQEEEIVQLVRSIQKRTSKDCRICFVDVPIHGQVTQTYSAYFAACYCADQSAENILKARQVLFSLAEKEIQDRNSIEQSLRKAQVKFSLEYGRIFKYFNEANRLMQEDKIFSTPTVVVVRGDGKRIFRGRFDLADVLEAL